MISMDGNVSSMESNGPRQNSSMKTTRKYTTISMKIHENFDEKSRFSQWERVQSQNLLRTERTSQVASKNTLYVLASDQLILKKSQKTFEKIVFSPFRGLFGWVLLKTVSTSDLFR